MNLLKSVMVGLVITQALAPNVSKCAQEMSGGLGSDLSSVVLTREGEVMTETQYAVMQELRLAIHQASHKKIRGIVEKDPGVLSRMVDGETPPLIEAVLAGHVNVVGALLDVGADIETKRVSDWVTPLLAACQKGQLPMVRFLLNRGASVHARDCKGNGSLHKASFMRDSTMVTLLLEKEAKVNCKNGYGVTPLIVAAGMGDETTVRKLITWSADVNAASDVEKMTALHAASSGGNSDLAQFLLESKADVVHTTQGNGTVLMRAAIVDDVVMAVRLINGKADPCAVDEGNCNALDFAYSPAMSGLLEEAVKTWRVEHGQESVEEKESNE